MLQAVVVPEVALCCGTWELFIGMPIQQVIDILKRQESLIHKVKIWYSDEAPFDTDIIFYLPGNGLKLYFEPKLQRLKKIEVVDVSKLSLYYQSQKINNVNKPPNLSTIIKAFGSTKQLHPDEEPGFYRLCYRGLTFLASQPDAVSESGRSSATASSSPHASPIGGSSLTEASTLAAIEENLVVRRVIIFSGAVADENKLPPQLPAMCFNGNVFLERLKVVHDGLRTSKLCFDLIYQVRSNAKCTVKRISSCVRFGDTAQDVLSALGSPSRRFFKTQDKMLIHLPQWQRQGRQRRCDFFYNFFTLGLDVLFEGRGGRVASFVLHTNAPGDFDFGTYYRCPFEIPLTVKQENGETREVVITPSSKIQALLGDVVTEDPVVVHRTEALRKCPFGVTQAYNYRDLIFEVLEGNGHLTSLTIYSLPDEFDS